MNRRLNGRRAEADGRRCWHSHQSTRPAHTERRPEVVHCWRRGPTTGGQVIHGLKYGNHLAETASRRRRCVKTVSGASEFRPVQQHVVASIVVCCQLPLPVGKRNGGRWSLSTVRVQVGGDTLQRHLAVVGGELLTLELAGRHVTVSAFTVG